MDSNNNKCIISECYDEKKINAKRKHFLLAFLSL